MTEQEKACLSKIEILVLDVDGVLTDGSLVINSDASESKFFNVLDGQGLRLFKRAGYKVAFLSGRESEPTEHRAKQLEVDCCRQGCHYKLPVLKEIMEQFGLSASQVAYIGDDLPDLPPIRYAGFGIAVANAVDEVKSCADYVTKCRGGSGAVREVVEYILKNNGKWPQLMERYLSCEEF